MSQAIIEKVRKLLALSKSSNVNEATNAAAIANRLIDEYRLSVADYDDMVGESDPMMEDPEAVYSTGRIVPWKVRLIGVLAQHYGCATYNSVTFPKGRKESHIKLVGRKSDIDIVRYMSGWLMVECQRLSDLEAKGKGKVFCNSYCEGFVAGVSAQLAASRTEAQKAATSSAIVKINSRYNESVAYLHSQYKLKSGGGSKIQLDRNAYNAGVKQGQNVHLGASLQGSKAKLLNG
jgi:hypothetical protein